MATAVTRVTRSNLALFDEEAKKLAAWHAAGKGLPNLTFVGSVDESRVLNTIRSSAVIIAGSGMCTAGRIKHHLLHNLGRRENAVLITGFQAQGTLGRRLVDGAERVRIFGQDVAVRASIHTLGGFSAHADQSALLHWLGAFRRAPDAHLRDARRAPLIHRPCLLKFLIGWVGTRTLKTGQMVEVAAGDAGKRLP